MTASLRATVRRTIIERQLIPQGARVLAACSGGPDSTAMVHVLSCLGPDLGFDVLVASVDHGLREGSMSEVAAVGRLSALLGLPFRSVRLGLLAGESLQSAARRARYAALHELASADGASRIAVGHTRDDQAETVVARLLRGAGISGVAAIAPHRADGVVRPLIDCPRALVHTYLERHDLPYVSDPSNLDRRFERVRVRLDVMPALAKEDPGIARHLAALADEARCARRLASARARRLLGMASDAQGRVFADVLMSESTVVRRAALALWIEGETGEVPRRRHVMALDYAVTTRASGRVAAHPQTVRLPHGWVLAVLGDGALRAHPSTAGRGRGGRE